MNAVLLRMLQITFSASVLIAAVVMLRLLLLQGRVSRNVLLFLWLIVGIRLVVPVSIGSALGVLPSFEGTEAEAAAVFSANILAPLIQPFRWQVLVLILYAGGVLAMLIYFAVSYVRLSLAVRKTTHIGWDVYLSDTMKGAFIFGFSAPKIILPAFLDESARDAVIRHEQYHLAHRDHIWKPLAFFILALHWFNPLVWLAYILFIRDLEFACDERAVRDMSVEERKTYSETLLLLGSDSHPISVQAVAFSEGNVEQRIKAVCRFRQPAVLLSIAAIVFALVLGACAMTYRQTDFPDVPGAPDYNETQVRAPEEGRETMKPEDRR